MMPRKPFAVVLTVLPLLLFMSAGEAGRPSTAMDFAGKVVNFVILFGGLAFVLRKPLAAMLRKRSADIRDTIRLADEGSAEAAKKYEGSEARLAGLEGDVLQLKNEAEEDARMEKDRIARLAAEESDRVRQFTGQEIDEQVRAGAGELRAYAAEQATALARERIRKRLTAEGQAALINKSIERLSRFYEKSGSR
ncbi:MAG: ATP synthase F0 subunit B [Candidatus Aminicenantales bacterium]|jgi:F0F1-type ATP synthase membrane subunit b/b'